jgi:C-terminal processing protease CtpA/Prc
MVSLLCSFIFFSCKKDATAPQNNNNNNGGGSGTSSTSDEDSLKYLMYRIMQVTYADGGRNTSGGLPTYYWYNQIPSIDPFSTTYSTAENLLSTMISYPEDQGGNKLDRYSFLDRTGSLANKLQNGVIEKTQDVSGSFGMEVTFALDQNNKSHLMVVYADKNSPAGVQGVQRGWEITAINGDNNLSYDGSNGANTNKVTNAVYNSSSGTFTFKKPDNNTSTIALQASSYNVNPVLYDTIYNISGKQVGYFVFYTFSSITSSTGSTTVTKQVLDQVFSKFRSAGIRELIVDLRYNTGGAVSTAQYLDNAIAPASAQSKVMYHYVYNDKLTQNLAAAGLPAAINFGSTGSLNLDHVFFITGAQTASASELTLNNLKPYMNVKLVGDTTYGKPVGFFSYTISDHDAAGKEKYLADLFAINFETRNAQQSGGYYNGISPDQSATDYVNVPWGNTQDDHLSKIFSYISTGSFRQATTERIVANPAARINIPKSVNSGQFNGMVDFDIKKNR